ncbi:hypothetical protein Tco_1416197, partial [Tanacetum coccineum]
NYEGHSYEVITHQNNNCKVKIGKIDSQTPQDANANDGE